MLQQATGRSSFFPALRGNLPQIVRGEGIYIFDDEGRRYIDGAGGLGGVTSIGHGVQEIVEAMVRQARQVCFIPAFQFISPTVLELCDRIAAITPGDLNRVMLLSGGSEATESAVKLARQHHVERGNAGKFKVIARWQGFHGMTLGATGFGGHTGRRRKYAPMLQEATHIGPAYRYRCRFCASASRCTLACAEELERAIRWEGPENVAAFIAEPVVGAAMGAVPAPEGYFQAVREICDRYDVLFIADEVICGFGRTGRTFAVEHWDVVPDILVAGKGLSGGYTPLSAVIARERVLEPLERNGSAFVAGHTYGQNPLSAAVGLAVLEYVQQHDLVRRAAEMGAYLLQRLERLRRHPIVGDVRGLGLLPGVEFVRDPGTKEPFRPELRAAYRVTRAAMERGLVVYPGVGTADGLAGDHVLLAPPLVIARHEVDRLVEALDAAVEAVATPLLEQERAAPTTPTS